MQRAVTPLYIQHIDPILSAGLRESLKGHGNFRLAGVGPEATIRRAVCGAVPIMIADYGAALRALSASPTQVSTVILTHFNTAARVDKAVRCGVRGYLLQGVGIDRVLECLEIVNQGGIDYDQRVPGRFVKQIPGSSLTAREEEVARWVARGLSNKRIAQYLNIEVGTVKTHLKTIFSKLNVGSRTQLAHLVHCQGLLTDSSKPAAPLQSTVRLQHNSERGEIPEASFSAGVVSQESHGPKGLRW